MLLKRRMLSQKDVKIKKISLRYPSCYEAFFPTKPTRNTDPWDITKAYLCDIQISFSAVKVKHFNKKYIFTIFAKNIDCGYTLEPSRRGGSNEYPQSVLDQK